MNSFKELGVNGVLAEACKVVGWKKPTKIQVGAIPAALKGKDIIGIAQPGSGKTGAFAIPILQALLENPNSFFACVISPRREFAIEVANQFKALGGSDYGFRCAVLVDGLDDFMQQSIDLGKWPHIVVATPGRLVEHLCNTKVFSLRWLKFLVLDEADILLKDDFELVDEILNAIPPQLRIYLFSATMTQRVKKLQRAYLKDSVMIIEAASKYTLRQQVQEAKGISQMKINLGGVKKKRKCDEDDNGEENYSLKSPRPLTELGKKLKEKLEELRLPASPKKTCVEVCGRETKYNLVFPNGVTLPICTIDTSFYSKEDENVPGPILESERSRVVAVDCYSAASGPSSPPLGEGNQPRGLPPIPVHTEVEQPLCRWI